jgi:hypothetical protein
MEMFIFFQTGVTTIPNFVASTRKLQLSKMVAALASAFIVPDEIKLGPMAILTFNNKIIIFV